MADFVMCSILSHKDCYRSKKHLRKENKKLVDHSSKKNIKYSNIRKLAAKYCVIVEEANDLFEENNKIFYEHEFMERLISRDIMIINDYYNTKIY